MKKVIVIGLGISGKGMVYFLKDKNMVYAYDAFLKEIDESDYSLKGENVKVILGENPLGSEDVDEVYISPGIDLDMDFIKSFKKRNIKIKSELDLVYENTKSENLINITGTNGKTTVTELTSAIYENYYKKENVSKCGNIGYSIARALKESNGQNHYIIETSSFQLESINDFKPYISCILNLQEDHLSRHKDFEGYKNAKFNIFKNQGTKDFLILNYDDENLRNIQKKIKPKTYYFSAKNTGVNGVYYDEKDGFVYSNIHNENKKLFNIEISNLIGPHNIENILASTLIALIQGVDKETIVKTIKNFHAPDHRLQKINIVDDVTYINDSKATNPASTIAALKSFDKKIILIVGGSDKGTEFDELVKMFNEKVKALLIFGQTKEKIAKTCDKYDFKDYIILNDLKNVLDFAKKIAVKDDIVLLSPACASYDMYTGYAKRGEHFKSLVENLKKE